jgi:hypothetical protein
MLNFGMMFLWLFVFYIGFAVLAVIVIFGWIFWKQRNKEFDGKYEDQERRKDP